MRHSGSRLGRTFRFRREPAFRRRGGRRCRGHRGRRRRGPGACDLPALLRQTAAGDGRAGAGRGTRARPRPARPGRRGRLPFGRAGARRLGPQGARRRRPGRVRAALPAGAAVQPRGAAGRGGAAIEHVGVDGCGVPVHVLPLRALATAYARIGHRAAAGGGPAAALVEAARRHPVMISGTGELDTRLLEVTGGRVLGKAGAEGASAAVNLDTNQGVAVKVLDGAVRARGPALLAALAALGWLDERELEAVLPVAATPIMGGGRQVGSVRPATIELTTG